MPSRSPCQSGTVQVRWPNEPLGRGIVEEAEQVAEEAIDVEHADRFLMDSELGPGKDLAEFIERPESSRQRDESFCPYLHRGLPFMHRQRDMDLGERLVGDLAFHQRAGDEPDYPSAGRERGIGDRSHQPDIATAIDELDAAPGDLPSEGLRRLPVRRVLTAARSAKYTD